MEIENLCKDIRARAFERKEPKTPEQVGASWYNDDLTYDGISKTLFIIFSKLFTKYFFLKKAYVMQKTKILKILILKM